MNPAATKGERTRVRILDAAEEEFALRGLLGGRLAHIAKVAKCPTALIHHYFDDKQTLYDAVVERATQEVDRDVCEILMQMELAFETSKASTEAVRAIVFGFVGALSSFYARHGSMLLMMQREAERASAFERTTKRLFEATVQRLLALQIAGVVSRTHDARDVCLFALARIMMVPLFPSLMRTLETAEKGPAPTDESRVEACAEAILRMLLVT
jgi:AcrR family transcriptional regulator